MTQRPVFVPIDVSAELLLRVDHHGREVRGSSGNPQTVWMLHDPRLHYIGGRAEELLRNNGLNGSGRGGKEQRTKEVACIEKNISAITSAIGKEATLLDFGRVGAVGPIQIIKGAMARGKTVALHIINTSPAALEVGARNAKDSRIEATQLHDDFTSRMGVITNNLHTTGQSFFFFGDNLFGFNPREVLELTRNVMYDLDAVYFSTPLNRGSADRARVMEQYRNEEVEGMCLSTLEHLGFRREDLAYEVSFNHETSCIECTFTVKELPEQLKTGQIQTGHRLLAMNVLLPDLNTFKGLSGGMFSGELMFSADKRHAAFIGKRPQWA